MRVAIYQSDAAAHTREERLAGLREVAEATSSDLILCPELFASGYAIHNDMEHCAESANGEFSQGVCDIIEFPEAARASALAGAEVILAPTALSEQWPVVAHNVCPEGQ